MSNNNRRRAELINHWVEPRNEQEREIVRQFGGPPIQEGQRPPRRSYGTRIARKTPMAGSTFHHPSLDEDRRPLRGPDGVAIKTVLRRNPHRGLMERFREAADAWEREGASVSGREVESVAKRVKKRQRGNSIADRVKKRRRSL